MTKEELEKEAEEFTDSKKSFWKQGRTCIDSVKQAYIAGAEPREERIAELKKENADLKAQIEKMKLCQNCRFESYDDMEEPCRNCSRLLGNIKRKGTSDKWEIKENE